MERPILDNNDYDYIPLSLSKHINELNEYIDYLEEVLLRCGENFHEYGE